jgi:hypothetical protein
MSDLTANVAVIGRVQLVTGILPVKLENPPVECLVAHAFPNKMVEPHRGIEVDTSDCTVFTVTHLNRGDIDLSVGTNVREIFEQSLSAISEVSIWTKSQDVVGKMSAFFRQIGTTDVKAFFVEDSDGQMVGWVSPAFTFTRDDAASIAGILSNVIFSNGPASNPTPPISRRVLSSLDLINLGFYTESFINLFSLVDDLTQEVIKAGMTQRGLNDDEQNGLLRAIKEERLKVYLCNLSKLCGWKSLDEENEEFFKLVVKVNSTRNRIMHGTRRLTRQETIEASNVLLQLINWLRSNPFGYQIPNLPMLHLAVPTFSIIPLKEKREQKNNDQPIAPNELPDTK